MLLALALLACGSSDRETAASTTQGAGGGTTTTSTGSGPAPQPTGAYDLDRDGVTETDLAIGACAAQPARLCLLVTSTLDVAAEVLLPEGAVLAGTAVMVGDEIHALGDFGGGHLSEVSVLYQLDQGSHTSPALSVLDCERGSILGTTSAPPALASFGFYGLASFTTFLRDPDDRHHPVLAPGYGDNAEQLWGEACVFDGTAAASGNCGQGFVRLDTIPPSVSQGWFREVGGYAFDMTTDGWDDLTLIYHSRVITFDGRTGARLGETVYDVAANDEPGSPPLFHSGRNYGTHATHLGSDGKIRTTMVGGTPVGAFDDQPCNVTRFVASLDLDPGAVAA